MSPLKLALVNALYTRLHNYTAPYELSVCTLPVVEKGVRLAFMLAVMVVNHVKPLERWVSTLKPRLVWMPKHPRHLLLPNSGMAMLGLLLCVMVYNM